VVLDGVLVEGEGEIGGMGGVVVGVLLDRDGLRPRPFPANFSLKSGGKHKIIRFKSSPGNSL